MKKIIFSFAITLTIFALSVVINIPEYANAQTATTPVVCPVGYTCTPIPVQPAGCPSGFVCTPTPISPSPTPVPIPISTSTQSCYNFSANLQLGSVGADVAALQTFLVAQGFTISDLTVGFDSAKGYFGNSTYLALKGYQSSVGIPATGFFGPLTRTKVNSSCVPGTVPGSMTVISPKQGDVYMEGTKVPITWSGMWSGSDTFNIQWELPNIPEKGGVIASGLSQAKAGCIGYGKGVCRYSWIPPSYVTGQIRIAIYKNTVVNDRTAEEKVYSGSFSIVVDRKNGPYISSLNPSFGTSGTFVTINGGNFQKGNFVRVSGKGFETSVIPNQSSATAFRVSIIPNQSSATQIMFYMPSLPADTSIYDIQVGYGDTWSNALQFYYPASTSQSPVITGVTAPTQLNVNQQGTWTVNAYDPQNSSLSYSVNWGDDFNCPTGYTCTNQAPTTASFVQNATFTHSYYQSGTYTPTFTVRNASGQTAETSATVSVGSVTTNPTIDAVTVSLNGIGTTNLQKGNTYYIKWSETNTKDVTRVSLYELQGMTWINVLGISTIRAVGVGENGIYWTVPSGLVTSSNQYKIYVETIGAGGQQYVQFGGVTGVSRDQVRQLYLDLQCREPDSQGWDYWSNSYGDINAVKQGMVSGIEYQTKQQIIQIFQQILGRVPSCVVSSGTSELHSWYEKVYNQSTGSVNLDVLRAGLSGVDLWSVNNLTASMFDAARAWYSTH
jgi:hypothetical protein